MRLARRPWLGVELGAPGRDAAGLPVLRVLPDSMAADAGLAPGDRLLAVGGHALTGLADVAPACRSVAGTDTTVLAWHATASGEVRARAVAARPLPAEGVAGTRLFYDEVEGPLGRLRTIVTRPAARGPHPALLFLQGMDAGSVDFWSGAPAPFAALVHACAAAGFVTLRVEKHGVGDSEGPPCEEGSFADEVAGFRAGLEALARLPFVDARRLYAFGHSVGGMVAPLVADAAPLAGIAVYGTSAERFRDCMLASVGRQAALRGLAGPALEERLRLQAALYEAFYVRGLDPDAACAEEPALAACSDPRFGRSARYVRELDAADLASGWARYRGHVLALHGEHDWVVSEAEAHALCGHVRRGGGHARAEVVPGADHFLGAQPSRRASFDAPGSGPPCRPIVERLLGWLATEDARGA
ncbi:MAG: alpha/beta fold hydrolase [Myxococcales bacterium]|nr:alpha/beta fold hydrolase [Myxococcales bacterium]